MAEFLVDAKHPELQKMGKEIIQYTTMNFRTVLSPRYVPIPGGRHNSIINSAKEAIMTEMMRS